MWASSGAPGTPLGAFFGLLGASWEPGELSELCLGLLGGVLGRPGAFWGFPGTPWGAAPGVAPNCSGGGGRSQ
eukprot:7383656-Pyramimonas_sp.AAC.1